MTDASHERDLIELLPWHVNGTLAADEQAAVEALLARSAAARAARAAWARIGDAERAEARIEVPAELGWRRLRREIAERPQPAADATGRSARRAPGLWKPLAATAAAVVICIQAVLLWQAEQHRADVRLLGGGQSDAPPLAVPAPPQFLVRFRDDVSWREVSDLLATLEVEIVHGPSALGVVLIRLAPDAADDRQHAAVLERLRRSAAVEHVQPASND